MISLITIELIMNFLKVFILAWWLTHFEPAKMVIDLIPESMLKWILQLILGCITCASFWIGLIIFKDLSLAALSSYIGFWYGKLIGPYELKVRF